MTQKHTTTLIRFFLIATLLFFKSNQSIASHAMGSDMTYTCLGPGPTPGSMQYQVTFSFYRDCFGITPSTSMDVQITNGCGYPTQTVFLNQLGTEVDVPTTCPTAVTRCHGGTYTGIQLWTYQGVITLPGPCANWEIGHGEPARNAAITTITGGGSDILYVFSTINNMNGLCNSSPLFTNPPVPFACVGQRFCFNHGGYDLDGDSLSYQLMTPRTGPSASDTVTYLPGYSTSSPILNSYISFDPISGDFCFIPTATDVSVFAVLVNEYRNGVLIGQVERDVQLTVENCGNIIPFATGINGMPFFDASICANANLSFYIASIDPDAPNTTTLTWNSTIPGATFTTTNGHRDSAFFSWTPNTGDISLNPYCFTVTVQDDNCPFQGTNTYSYCITVNGVEADAGPDQTISCSQTANLLATATGGNGIYNYVWDNGTIGDTQTGVGVGQYTVTVTSAGCTDTDVVDVIPGLGVPEAHFYFTNNCNGSPVQFTDSTILAGSSISTWAWDFGDGFTANTQNPTHQYAANGTYDVSLIVTTATGCTDTIVRPLTVNTNIPFAQFTSLPVCQGVPMDFTDISSGNPTTWSWDFGDAASGSNTSSLQNPSHSFSTSGNFTITISVTNAGGCQSISQQNVNVNPNPVISISDDAICEGATANIIGPSGFAIYTWNNSEVTQSITVAPTISTNYSLTVTDNNGCQGTDAMTLIVNPLPTVVMGPDQTICEGTSANLSAVGGTSYEWNPGAIVGQNVSVSPSANTNYVVTVTDGNGCVSTGQMSITVNPMPVVAVSSDMGVCKGESATISIVNGSGAYLWTPGNFVTASITVAPLATTSYTVTVSDAIGCSGSAMATINVNPIPNAIFNSSGPVCVDNSIAFTDNSTITGGSINTWSWDFGNGATSNVQSPSNLYTTSGNFNVRLIVVSDFGCRDTMDSPVTVNPNPIADAGLNQSICPGFNATLNGSGGTIYDWNSGAFVTQSITVSPAITTDYSLTVTDANGCRSTDVATVTVNPIPLANAGDDQSLCVGESTTLFASGGTSYLWTPGSVNTVDYSITPASSGVYSVLVTNQFGCVATDQVSVQVNPVPTATFAASGSICEDNSVSFTDQSAISTGTITSWTWDFGNGVSSSAQSPSIPYSEPGVYNVSLNIISDNGCTATVTNQQTIWATPVSQFTNSSVCFGLPNDFQNLSAISDASPLNYSWSFGDGNTSNSQSPSHSYTSYGAFPISLVVTSQNGCTDTYTSQANVFPLPVADFSVPSACEEDAAIFVNASTVPTGIISNYFWTFGDSSVSALGNPTHAYQDPGNYPIHLLITSDHGCQDSTDGLIRILPKPIIDFATEDVCQGYPVSFTDNSDPVLGSLTYYSWNFGDGNTTSIQDPIHTYGAPGWYSVSLTATNDSGCTSTYMRPNALQIYPAPVAQFVSNESQATDFLPLVNFTNQTTSPGLFYWSFGDGDSSTQYSPTHIYDNVGVYEVNLITIDNNGCIDSITSYVEIRPSAEIYIPNAFTPNGDSNNDVFEVYTHNVKDVQVQIYDRWGLKIVEWNDVKGGWDGRVNGNPAQSDTYVYRVSTVDVNEKQEVRIGHVSLVR